jgi:hypothetical protein
VLASIDEYGAMNCNHVSINLKVRCPELQPG